MEKEFDILTGAKRLDEVRFSKIRTVMDMVADLRAKGEKVLALSAGEPDFDTPAPIKEAVIKALEENYTHYGSNRGYPALRKLLSEKLEKETGADIEFINLSGGVGIPYKPDQEPNDIRVIGEGVRKVYEEVLVPAGMGDVALYTEMGRFMTGPYGCLVTKAIHEKHTYKEYIGCDACAVNLMRPAMYGAYHHITVMGKEDQPCDHMYDVTGSLCENNDKFAIDRYLPKVDMGDLLVIHDTGAHGFAMGYNYNGKLKSSEILLHEDGRFEMIRRAETPKDYFATFDCFPIYEKLLEDMK